MATGGGMQFHRAARRRRSASAGQRERQRTAADLAPDAGPSNAADGRVIAAQLIRT